MAASNKRRTLSIDDTDPPKISVDELTKLPVAERLRVSQALVIAAFNLCPAPPSENNIGEDRLALANCMLGAVHSLLHTRAERQREQRWDAMRERHEAVAAHVLN